MPPSAIGERDRDRHLAAQRRIGRLESDYFHNSLVRYELHEATLMLQQGTHPKVVAERLGHATVNVTLNVYSHVTPTMQREAAATMDKLLSGGA